MQNIQLESKVLGTNEKALLIAEVSANHDKDLDQALALVDIAADTGWDCLKLQTYSPDSLTLRSNHASMQIDAVWGKKTLYELYENACMPMDFHRPLFEKARDRGLLPFTSIYDPMDLDFIENLGCCIYKIASFELTFDALLACVAQTGKPIILSTGMATLDEVEHALEVLDKHRASLVVLLHCCSSYPAPADQINLRAMNTLGETFSRSVGYSDHTVGSMAAITAAAMGAVAIEKHFTNDITRTGPDHRFSATPDIMREISTGIEQIHELKGSAEKHTTDAELVSREKGRRSAFATRPLSAGHIITATDFRFVRPNAGIAANNSSAVIGQPLKHAVNAGHPITLRDITA
ncbi:MAG: pseudaminic acid synthase [Granulosicoccus sp.]|jgi:N-acetylneuraminate synthase